MPSLSAVIITFNEEKNIARCIHSLKDIADEVVVVDSFSTDNTVEICRQHGAKVIQRKWDDYSSAKNFGNRQAAHDWIFSIDADEAVSEELKKSILLIKGKGGNYQFNRLTNYCGKWIRHCGWYPDRKHRLFDRNLWQWEGTIHEKLKSNSNSFVSLLKGDLLHYSYESIEQHERQTEKFTDLSAAELFSRGIHPAIIKQYVSPVIKFFHCYFLKLGFLDGYYGFIICRISAASNFLKYKKLRTLYRK